MVSFISWLLIVAALLLAIPVVFFFLEIIASLILSTLKSAPPSKKCVRQGVAVLVPAHNESVGILLTLADIKAQLRPGDRLLVIADNCDDDTAAVAANLGLEIVERNEPARLGKGYALDFGLKHISLNPPDIVVIIDADCRVEQGTIEELARVCATTRRPAQALDLMISPNNSTMNYHVAEFAWRIKNWARPLGLKALGLPCQLMGTGMAFPWEIIRAADIANGSIVEDLKLGLELAQSGNSAIFCPAARVTSLFPTSAGGAKSQRKRWEEGHIRLILSAVPHLIYDAVARKNLSLFMLTLDLAVPPLSVLGVLLVGTATIAGASTLIGASSVAFLITLSCILVFVLAIFVAWFRFGRDILPASALGSVASYIFGKFPIYRQLLSGNFTSSWIRADRKKDK